MQEFGSQPQFSDSNVFDIAVIPSEDDSSEFVEAIATTIELDCIPRYSVHEVNTALFVTHSRGVNHSEGGWPLEVKTSEAVDRQRHIRRLMNEPHFAPSVVCGSLATSYSPAFPVQINLCKAAESIIAQNNTVDLYEQYFVSEGSHSSESFELPFVTEPHSTKTVSVIRDPSQSKRSATKLSWHPDGAAKLAVAYCNLNFQSDPQAVPSYIWDLQKTNAPDVELIPALTASAMSTATPLTSLAYNTRSPDHLIGGTYGGLLAFFDLRKGGCASDLSLLEMSHSDPVYDVQWVQTRTGNECASVSTDGRLLWWDLRKLRNGPIDSMWLRQDPNSSGTSGELMYTATSLEYRADAGVRLVIGGRIFDLLISSFWYRQLAT